MSGLKSVSRPDTMKLKIDNQNVECPPLTCQVLQKQYKAAFARWPKDQLRPDIQLQEVLAGQNLADRLAGRRIASPVTDIAIERATGRAPANPPTSDLAQLRQVNALFALLDDRFKKQHRVTGTLMTPRSRPTYYTELITELEEAPTRSFLGRLRKRLGGMFRLS
jgi:cytochrome b pre-mRNA-processing protein 6